MASNGSERSSVNSEHVRVSKSLCAKEEEFIKVRKGRVENWLKDNGIEYREDHVPVIAVLGSGGGQRAMVGLLGCLAQMGKENLLNSALYLCGVSGSTWCMSYLYKDSMWSSNLPSDVQNIIDQLSGPPVSLTDSVDWLLEAVKDETYSLTDFWAATVVCSFVKEINQSVLSQQQDSEAVNPYPIYTAVDQGLKKNNQSSASWFEISPHEAGYSHLGAFVTTQHDRCKFEGGQLVKQFKEKDMLYLQGLCGSAIADWDENIKQIKDKIWKNITEIFQSGRMRNIENICSRSVLESTEDAGCDCPACKELQEILQQCDGKSIDDQISEVLQASTVQVSGKGVRVITESTESITWQHLGGICDIATIVYQTTRSLSNWNWGMKNNFLKGISAKDVCPDVLLTEEIRYLEDAGLVLNSPYVTALRPERKVDLILSFDFSEGDPFLTVKQAADYCKQAGIPFPSVVIPDGEGSCPMDLYVFKDKAAPTVIHIPLFNRVNCGEQIDEFRKKYSTFTLPYSKEMLEELLALSGQNVINNKQKILQEIQEVCKRWG